MIAEQYHRIPKLSELLEPTVVHHIWARMAGNCTPFSGDSRMMRHSQIPMCSSYCVHSRIGFLLIPSFNHTHCQMLASGLVVPLESWLRRGTASDKDER